MINASILLLIHLACRYNLKMSQTFCPIPWIFHAARSNGDMRVCCQANVTANRGVIRKPDGTAYNVGCDDVDSSRNAELMKRMRLNMLNGDWSEECGRCRQEEQSGLVSRRAYEGRNWDFKLDDAQRVTTEDGSIDTDEVPLIYYDLRFGNFCNFKCRMCGPADSDSWYADHMALTGETSFWDTSGKVEIKEVNGTLTASGFDWYKHETLWRHLESNVDKIRHVYLAGGEPMLIDRHYIFLELCVDRGVAGNITIEYNTNMSTMPPRVIDLWRNFKRVNIGASVDGFGPVLEYQRHGAKWDKTLRNLRTLDGLPGNVNAWLAFTVTAYNVWHMVDFMRWKLEESGFSKINSSKRHPIITHHVAHYPHHLNIRVLPDALKMEITDRFASFVAWVREGGYPRHVVTAAETIAKGVVSYMNGVSYNAEHWGEFLRYTNRLDSIRGESIVEVEPMFSGYI